MNKLSKEDIDSHLYIAWDVELEQVVEIIENIEQEIEEMQSMLTKEEAQNYTSLLDLYYKAYISRTVMQDHTALIH